MPKRWVLVATLLLVAAGCGEATWNPDLKAQDALERGTPFVDALAKHGCPDSVQEIDSETFTATWKSASLVAPAPFVTRARTGSLSYLVRKGKLGGVYPSFSIESGFGIGFGADARSPLRSNTATLGLFPLVAIFVAWQVGRALREKARIALAPLVVLSLLLLGLSFKTERSGVAAAGGGVSEGSFSGALVDELGPPSDVIRLPGESGTLLVYRTGERKHVIVGGSESGTAQAFLVQKGRVVAVSAKTTTIQAQYYLFPFFETAEARVHAAIAWSVALGTLALFLTTRPPRKPPVESTPRA